MNISEEAIEAAKEAMREVTPPPGVSKADWLAEYGDFALIAGAIAAAAPCIKAQAIDKAADDADGLSMISEAAVEAAAKAIFDNVEVIQTRGYAAEIARLAIEAAAPHMLAEAWEQGRDAEFQRSVMKRQTDPNPYRSQA